MRILDVYKTDPKKPGMSEEDFQNEKIHVCSECLLASCWHGVFMCYEADYAGTRLFSRKELIEFDRENRCYIRNLT